MRNNKNRVMVIGLDGATYTLLQPLMDDGTMPNLKRIMENGSSGILNSTLPPITAPAWTSFATGLNPGKHGAHDFVVRDGNNEMVVINSRRINSKKIWNIMSEHDLKVGIIHFPISYPPEKVNGYMISGFISPPGKNNYSYPPELYSEIVKNVGDYIFNVKVPVETKMHKLGIKDIKPFIDRLYYEMDLRYKALKYLMNKESDWDFLYVLFMSFDKIQHVLWKYLDRNNNEYKNDEIYEYVIKCYKQVDDILGNILSEMDDDTSMVILSDHGFGPKDKWFYINMWLEENGYLKKDLGRLVGDKVKVAIGLKSGKFFDGIPAPTVKRSRYLKLDKTIAYSPNSSSYGIVINLKDRDKHGTIDRGDEYNSVRNELKEKLLNTRDRETGDRIIESVYFPEEIYSGPFLESAPDLILYPAKGYMLIDSLMNLNGKNLVKVKAAEGTHRMEGIFMVIDKENIKKGLRIDKSNIIDIAPTILYLLGLPVDTGMDGKIISSIFNEHFLRSNEPVYTNSHSKEEKTSEEEVYSGEDEQKIMDELKGLGYID